MTIKIDSLLTSTFYLFEIIKFKFNKKIVRENEGKPGGHV